MLGWLAGATLMAGCGIAGTAPVDTGATARPHAAGIDLSDTDPCTLLNVQQQTDLGGIDVVQPVPADAGNAACEYLQRGPQGWSVTITVPDHEPAGQVPRESGRGAQQLSIEGFPALRQDLPDGCAVDVDVGPGQDLAVRTQGPGLPAHSCETATRAATLAVSTVKKRH
ncbi:MAG: DUF3558 family protein [Pseudonocardiaceae bacterium]